MDAHEAEESGLELERWRDQFRRAFGKAVDS